MGDEAGPRQWLQGRSRRVQSDLARAGVEGRGPVAAEVDVDPALLDHRGGRREAVVLAGVLRLGDVEELRVEEDVAVVAVEGQDGQLLALGGRGGEPDLLAEDHGRRPAAAVDARLPDHVLRLAPGRGKAHGVGVPGARGATELRPLVGGSGEAGGGEEEPRRRDRRGAQARRFYRARRPAATR